MRDTDVKREIDRMSRKQDDDDIQDYVRPWRGLTEQEFLEAAQIAERGNYLVAFQRIQQWLKERNHG
jgi:hypothetical protein